MSIAAASNMVCSRSVLNADVSGHHRRTETIAQHRDTVDPWTLRIQFAQPPCGLMQWQHAVNGHRRDQRIVDQDRHG